MTRYVPKVDLWDEDTRLALEEGSLQLQTGQWITCGKDADYPSRLHKVIRDATTGNVRHIRAFHGPEASKRFMQYCKAYQNGTRKYARLTADLIKPVNGFLRDFRYI